MTIDDLKRNGQWQAICTLKDAEIEELKQQLAKERRSHSLALDTIYTLLRQLAEARRDTERLRDVLGLMYDKWENGEPSFEDPETYGGFLGNAFKLSYEEENEILSLIPTHARAIAGEKP